MSRIVPFSVLGLVLVAFGCGGAASEQDLHAAFARIQVEEARIEHAAHARESGGEALADAAPCAEMRGAAEAICRIAADVDDRDARLRCERARERAAGCGAEP